MKEPYELDVEDGHCVVGVWLPKVAAQDEEVLPGKEEDAGKLADSWPVALEVLLNSHGGKNLLVEAALAGGRGRRWRCGTRRKQR